ncbi:YncE family protein [Sorangium cellulosum]|uniref:YncE family protein n=1 Tax=Sorangium cellulosum TaxID=56 RepID=UPI000A48BCD1|nr:hypothetical protein [Sorangium cellulosum]
MRFVKRSMAVVAWMCAAGCSGAVDLGPGAPEQCVPGRQVPCACLGGDVGVQQCLSDATFGQCVCPGDAGGTSGVSASSSGGTGGFGGNGAGGSGGDGGFGAGGSAASELIEVDVEARHVIADRVRGVFYATVGGDAAEHANSLVVVDAASAKVIDSVFVGSQPLTMALSDDGSTLWVSLQGSYEIRRVDLTSGSPVPGEQYPLPAGDWGDIGHAGPMVVLPGTTDSVALSLHREGVSPSYAGSVVVDSGVARPDQTSGHTGASRLTGGPAGWLFGFNNLHTGFGFYALEVTETGLVSTEHEELISGFDTDIVYADGRVYATSGEIVNVSTPSSPRKAGEFAFDGAVLPLAPEPRLLMLSVDFSEPAVLRLLDTETFAQIDAVTYPDLDIEGAFDLVSPDGESLAFIGSGGFDDPPRLFVLANPLDG